MTKPGKKKKGNTKGSKSMTEDIRDVLTEIQKEQAVQGERQEQVVKDIKEIKETTFQQDKRCRDTTASYTAALNVLNGKVIKHEGCIMSVKGQYARMIKVVIATAALVSAIGVVVAFVLKHL